MIRISRLAVVNVDSLLGLMGGVGKERITFIKNRLSDWLKGE